MTGVNMCGGSKLVMGVVLCLLFVCTEVSCAKMGSTVLSTVSGPKELGCSNVRYAYTAKGYSNTDVPFQAISGDGLRICDRGLTCCTTDMEHKLSTHSRAEFDALLRDTIGQVRATFAQQAQRFDEYFKELLRTSKKDFHEMFLRTYGMLYDRNSFIFKDLFDDLEKYYSTGGVDLTAALDSFFDRLYRKMFQVLNSQYTFSELYMTCISGQMDVLKPFGDVPKKLTTEVKRSFVATRTFVQALAIGRDVAKFVQEVGPTPECSRALMRMTYCPHCSGLPDTPPCSDYCLNVMRGCLAYHSELHAEWTNYINAMMMLASRLESSFNIETVVDPIDIKISDAIMNFQENGQAVSQELFKACGKPRLGKRETHHELQHMESVQFGDRPSAPATGTSIDRLVDGIRRKIRRTRGFWTRLSSLMCSDQRVAGSKHLPSDHCWNGQGKDRYVGEVMGEGVQNQTRNPEVHLEMGRQNSIINQQILTLKLITTKLTHAYNGLDVEWQDAGDSDWSSSGSGSGSGFGDDDEPSTDDNFGDIYFSTPSSPPHRHRPTEATSSAPDRWRRCALPLLSAAATFLIARWTNL